MKKLLEGTALRTGVVAAAALAGGLLTSAPASAATATSERSVTSVTLTAESAAAARPRNGRILHDRISGGPGKLKIKNGLSRDGVVTLVRGKTKAVSIYVRAKSSATIGDVSDGTYRVYFTTGYRFSVSKGRFTRAAVYQRFDERLRYRTSGGQYRIYTLTLNPVKGGNARTRSIDPKDFPA